MTAKISKGRLRRERAADRLHAERLACHRGEPAKPGAIDRREERAKRAFAIAGDFAVRLPRLQSWAQRWVDYNAPADLHTPRRTILAERVA